MKNNFENCLASTLQWEGGFVDHPKDPGGMTNLGITAKTFSRYYGFPATKDVMLKLTVDKVKPIYKKYFWDVVHGDDLPIGLDLCVFDFAVNSGPKRAAQRLQFEVGAEMDGIIGSNTLAKVRAHNVIHLITAYTESRASYVESLGHFDSFGAGWLNRIYSIKSDALRMLES